MRPSLLAGIAALAFAMSSLPVVAETVQSLSARVDGQPFVSDHDSITLIPVSDSFTLVALTAGATSWPPPKTPVDRLSIVCRPFAAGQALVLDNEAFAHSGCSVTFARGHRGMGQAPDAEYQLDKSFAGNRFEVVRASGKVIEGTFTFQLRDAGGATLSISDGRFVAEDQQY